MVCNSSSSSRSRSATAVRGITGGGFKAGEREEERTLGDDAVDAVAAAVTHEQVDRRKVCGAS